MKRKRKVRNKNWRNKDWGKKLMKNEKNIYDSKKKKDLKKLCRKTLN